MTSIVATDKAPAAVGPYSQAVKAHGFLYTAGQIPLRPDGTMVEGTIAEQTEQVMTNLAAVLAAAGCGFEHVVKTTCFLRDMNDFAEFNTVYGSRFTAAPPARSTVAVSGLPKGASVEVELVALLPA